MSLKHYSTSFVCLGTCGVSDFFQPTFRSHTYTCLLLAEISQREWGQVEGKKTMGTQFGTLNFDLPGALRDQNPMLPDPLSLSFAPSPPYYTHVKHPVEVFCSSVCHVFVLCLLLVPLCWQLGLEEWNKLFKLVSCSHITMVLYHVCKSYLNKIFIKTQFYFLFLNY